MTALLFALACTGGGEDVAKWRVEPRMESAPLAQPSAYPLDTGAEAYFIAQHVVPGLHWGNSPSTEIALDMWTHIMGENVADPGSCPYGSVDGGERTWQTNCRSQDGYNWSGTASQVTWEEAGQEWERWEFDIEVDSDVESRSFDRIAMKGEFWFAGSNGEDLQSHTETNLVIEADGYWDQGSRAKLEDTWSRLALTGTWETWLDAGGDLRTFQAQGVVENSLGGVTFEAPDGLEDDGCATEPRGDVLLKDGAQQVRLSFEAGDRCDNCAQYSLDQGSETLACRTSTWL